MDTENQTITRLQNERGKTLATICCFVLGMGSLLTWNSMLTVSDYYCKIFPDYHISRVLALMYYPNAICTLIYLTWNESRINIRKRNLAGYLLFGLSSFLLIVLDLVSHGKGHIVDYVLLCLICGSFGVVGGLIGGGVVGDLSLMDPIFLQSFFCGIGASGALSSGLRLMTNSLFDKHEQGLRLGALLFMAISTVIKLVCIWIYIYVFPRIPIVRLYRIRAAFDGSRTVSADLAVVGVHQDDNSLVIDRLNTRELIVQNWDYALDLYLIKVLTLSIFPGFLYENTGTHGLGSWYPLVLIAVYNVCDLIARYTPLIKCLRITSRKVMLAACIARGFFIPAFYFTAKYADKGWMLMLISLLGLTNGHLSVCVMMTYPQGYRGPEQNALGNALVVFLLLGTFSGAALDWLWIIGNGTF